MGKLADQISNELRVLIGEPISDCWRAADMHIFGFGPLKKYLNRQGEEVEGTDIKIHIQCRWRVVDENRILFGRDDLLRPADEKIPAIEFDNDKDLSVLDILRRDWFTERREKPLLVIKATGDQYGGFRIELEQNIVLEAFPCRSDRGEYSEHWRLLGHRSDDSHFVITGYGVEDDRHEASTGG